MSVRTNKRIVALTLFLSVVIGVSLAYAQAQPLRMGDVDASVAWVPPGHHTGGLGPHGDPDGVQGSPPTGTRKAGARLEATPLAGAPESATWSVRLTHWFAGLLQRIGFRY